jgi:LacI family transcriptional regulator
MAMRTKLKDVAEQLNLSPALVSGVLNGKANVWASEETRARVFEAVRTLNYHPSTAAQALSRGKTKTVALVYRRLEGIEYRLAYSGLVDTFSAEVQDRGYDLMVSNFAEQEDVMTHLRRLASARACDAVILWGREADTEPQGELLELLRMPFLVKGRHEKLHPNWFQIDFDHEWMMANAVESVVKLGHRRLAYLGFKHDDAFVRALRRGFVDGHKNALGHEPKPEFFGEFEDEVIPNEERIESWLNLPENERPTAFVIGSGNHAWQALESSLARHGRCLGFAPDNFAAAGISSFSFTLMFGEAMAYQGIEIDNLARCASPSMLNSILTETGGTPIVRFQPQMIPAPTLGLLNHGVAFVNSATGQVSQ